MAIWGALLGTGVLTVIPHAVVLLLPAFAVAIGSPLAAFMRAEPMDCPERFSRSQLRGGRVNPATP